MGVQWTPEQRRAIDLPFGQGNILVSAAAGSGKTAVLVERIFEKIYQNKQDIDRFLVVTFTKAAAAGMKDKIEQRFHKELENASTFRDQQFWKRQISLLSMADITTIDSFCLNILKNNFQHLGIDPNFFIMDDVEFKLLRQKVIEELFDSLYEAQDAQFLSLVDQYASFRSDDRLIRLIFYIHDFISDFAEPMKWLHEKADMYRENMAESPWGELCISGYAHVTAERAATESAQLLDRILYEATGLELPFAESEQAAEVTRVSYGKITDSLERIQTAMTELLQIHTIAEFCEWNVRYACGKKLLAENMPAKITEKLRETENFEFYMKETKALAKRIQTELSILNMTSPQDFYPSEKAAILRTTVLELAHLTELFDKQLMTAKHKRNAYTFLDIEHMTYTLFRDNADIRKDYTERYTEILIDEYQDTNGLQDAIFAAISENNIFMVGDLKQSIYRFRGGDPYIFKEKSRLYESTQNSGTKVSLAKNFRSRSEVIDSVNDIFDCIMSETVGDVTYSGTERLICGMENEKENFYRSEFHILESLKTDKNEEELERAEARYTAQKIQELHGKPFYDIKNNVRRPLRYSDFTILLRAVKNRAKIYSEVFEEYGIPLLVELNDYFENSEIKAMTALLSVIDNARQDVPLITALRSALFHFTDDELAYISAHFRYGKSGKKKYFYDCVCACAAADSPLSTRCRAVTDSIQRWRKYTKRKSVAGLIWSIYEETGFYDYASAAGGDSAQANLRLLYERAKQYEHSGFKGLFSFTKYIESLKERKNAIAGARIIRHDVVSLMTIHKSKGLEFPVVILGGMGQKALPPGKPEDSRVALHKDFGIGLLFPDIENEFYGNTPFKMLVDLQNRREDLSEKMRLLYVALTRAQYKIIAVASYVLSDADELSAKKTLWQQAVENGVMHSADVLSGISYGDWMIPAALHSRFWDINEVRLSEVQAAEKSENPEEDPHEVNQDELKKTVYSLLDYRYPYQKSTVIPSRTTATEMKEQQRQQEKGYILEVPSQPSFMRDKKNSAQRGTAYHNAVAYINLDVLRQNPESIRDELMRLSDEGRMDGIYADDTMIQKLYKLFQSELGQRMLQADTVYREKNFQTLIDSSEYTGIQDENTEPMILQGVIDCFFTESDGTTVLIDYKTDKVRNGNIDEIAERYRLQLDLYTQAIEKVAKTSVQERYLYLFDINKAVKL